MRKDSVSVRAGSAALSLFPHLLMAFSWMMLTFYVINILNPAMFFLTSETSQKFEILYAIVTLICSATAFFRKHLYADYHTELNVCYRFLQKSLRILGIAAALFAIGLAVPVIIAMTGNNRDSIENSVFYTVTLLSGIVTLLFSVSLIAVQHRQAIAAYQEKQS